MGQHHSSPLNLQEERAFLRRHTNLNDDEITELYQVYSKKNKLTKKEFLSEFRKTFPQ